MSLQDIYIKILSRKKWYINTSLYEVNICFGWEVNNLEVEENFYGIPHVRAEN